MADKPNIFKFEDSQTGKVYQIEGDPDTTQEEAINYLDSLDETGLKQYEYVPPNAITDAPRETSVATKAMEEVPGAREYAEELFWKGTSFDEADKAFTTKFPGVQFSKEQTDPRTGKTIAGPQLWAESLAFAQTPQGRNYFQNNSPFAPVNRPTGVEDPEAPESIAGEFLQSGVRSVYQMANTIRGAGAVGADIVGADETAEQWANDYLEQGAAIDLNLPSSAGYAKDIESVDDAGRWLASTLGEVLPQVGISLGAGYVARAAAEKVASKATQKFVERRMAEGIAEEVAKQEAKNIIERTGLRAAIAGAAVPSEVQEVGSIYGDTYGATGELKPWTSLLAGTAAASLDTILPAHILKKFGGEVVQDAVAQSLVKRVGKEAASTFLLLEGGTEALQTIIEQLPAGQPIDWDSVVEAGLRGAVGGTAVGGATAVYDNAQQRRLEKKLGPRPTAAQFPDAPTVSVPTATGRRTKDYKQQIGESVQGVSDRINHLTSDWENKPTFEVHQNLNKVKGVDNGAIGAIRDGKVLISTENVLKEAARRNVSPDVIVNAVTFHEGLGHHGLDLQFGQALDDKLSEMLANSKVYQGRVNAWLKKHPDAYAGDPNRDIRAFEELLAERSEGGKLPSTVVNQLKNSVKDFGRRMGLTLEYSTREVETILGMAHAAVINGKGQGGAAKNGFRFMYAGEKAETANLRRLEFARLIERQGRDVGPDGVTRLATGWFKGKDGEWRFEINDRDAQLVTLSPEAVQQAKMELGLYLDGSSGIDVLKSEAFYEYGVEALPLSEVLNHEKLFEAYPELRDVLVSTYAAEEQDPTLIEAGGVYEPTLNAIYVNPRQEDKSIRSIILHEVQHYIQFKEGFALGGSPESAMNIIPDYLLEKGANQYLRWLTTDEAKKEYTQKQIENRIKWISDALRGKDYRSVRQIIGRDETAATQAYFHLYGEAEARDVERRSGFNNAQREAIPPLAMEEASDVTSIDTESYIFDSISNYQKSELPSPEATVYHGSPHDFNEFDHSKIGSGEGAQVYGWGTYLTETESVAKGYKNTLSGRLSNTVLTGVDGQQHTIPKYYDKNQVASVLGLDPNNNSQMYPVEFALDQMQGGDTVEEAVDWAYKNYPHYPERFGEGWDIGLQNLLGSGARVENTGKVYHVEIPDDANWILWDKPFSGQSPKVQEILKKKFGIGDTEKLESQLKEVKDSIARIKKGFGLLETAKSEAIKQAARTEEGKKRWAMLDKTSQRRLSLIRELERKKMDLEWEIRRKQPFFQFSSAWDGSSSIRELQGSNIYHLLEREFKSDKEASLALNEAGVTGIKYLDGMSRNQGEGSYNYVVFNDKTPKITHKYMMMTSPDKVEMTPEEIAEMSPEDLIEAENAFDLLQGMTKGYTPVVLSLDDLKNEVEARGLTVSRVMDQKSFAPGEITKRLFMFDIAMQKMDEKLTTLYGKMMDGSATAKDRADFAHTEFKRTELAHRIWDEYSEVARALRAQQDLVYTARRAKGAKDTAEQLFKKGSPFELLNDPEEFYKHATSIMAQIEEGKTKAKERGLNAIGQAINLPRSIMSSMDFSAPLRQGIFLIHKKAWWTSFAAMFRYAGSTQTFNDLMEEISNRPTYGLMIKANLALSNLGADLNQREEAFQSAWAEKIPVLGKGVQMSERAYVGFLNKLRADVFDELVRNMPDDSTDQDYRDVASFVNAASGRGDLPKVMKGAAPMLNGLFFSPRLMASRIKMTTVLVDPRTYVSMNKTARKEYMKSLFAVGGIALMITTLAAMAGAEVEDDPRSSDFAKVKIGDTRYDILGGEGQYLVLAARLIRNSYKTTDGDIKQYGTKYGQTNRFDALTKFITNKASPIPSFVIDYLRGVDPTGKKFDLDSAIINRFTPMFIQDVAETMQERGTEGALMSAPGIFGVGVQTYSSQSMDTDRDLEPPDDFEMKDAVDGDYGNAVVEDGTVRLDDKAKAEWALRLNTYYKEWLKDEMSDPAWNTYTDDERREVIAEVRKDARAEAKADMVEMLGIEEQE